MFDAHASWNLYGRRPWYHVAAYRDPDGHCYAEAWGLTIEVVCGGKMPRRYAVASAFALGAFTVPGCGAHVYIPRAIAQVAVFIGAI